MGWTWAAGDGVWAQWAGTVVHAQHVHLGAWLSAAESAGSEQRGPTLLLRERPPAAGCAWTGPGLARAVPACRGQPQRRPRWAQVPGRVPGRACASAGGLDMGGGGRGGPRSVVCGLWGSQGEVFAALRGGGTAGWPCWHMSLELRAGLEAASGVCQGWMAFLPESEETAEAGAPTDYRGACPCP